jgi:hypothetical protein
VLNINTEEIIVNIAIILKFNLSLENKLSVSINKIFDLPLIFDLGVFQTLILGFDLSLFPIGNLKNEKKKYL